MKLIEKGKIPKNPEIKKTCYNCKTKFSYNSKDVNYDQREGNYVVCPVCKKYISTP